MPDRERRRLKRLYWNVRLLGLPEPLRDFWQFIITGLVAWAFVVQGQQANDAARTARLAAETSQQTTRLARQTADIARETARNARRTTRALCALRRDFETRVRSGEQFIRTHPEGFAGISAAQIRVQLDQQRRTIRALTVVKCHAP